MTVKVRLKGGMDSAKDGDIRGNSTDQLITGGGVADLATGHAAVTQNGGGDMTVNVAKGVIYVPNALFDQYDSDTVRYYELVNEAILNLTITPNTSGSTRYDLICGKVDTTIDPGDNGELAGSILVVVGTPSAGVPATPSNHYKIAEITVTNALAAVLTANITDRRAQMEINNNFLKTLRAAIETGIILYAADAGANDTYAITLSPVPTAYVDGMVIHFKANTANTGAATLNVNSLGAITIKKMHDQDLATGDIEANQHVTVIYNSTTTAFEMQSERAQVIENDLVLSANTTNDVSTSKHGFTPILPNDATKYLDGTGAYSIPDVNLTAAPSADLTGNGMKLILTAGENLVFGEVGYIKSDGKVGRADASVIATSSAIVMALATIANNASGNFLVMGIVRNDAWNWTVGGLIYLSETTGALTQTAPTPTDTVTQILGVATHADRMFFNPQLVQVEHT